MSEIVTPAGRGAANNDQRKQGRYELGRVLAGELDLRCGDERFRIQAINDISSSGISVFVDQAIAVPRQVVIEYFAAGARFEVNGNVVWCAQSDTMPSLRDKAIHGRYLMGLELLSPLLLMTFLQHG